MLGVYSVCVCVSALGVLRSIRSIPIIVFVAVALRVQEGTCAGMRASVCASVCVCTRACLGHRKSYETAGKTLHGKSRKTKETTRNPPLPFSLSAAVASDPGGAEFSTDKDSVTLDPWDIRRPATSGTTFSACSCALAEACSPSTVALLPVAPVPLGTCESVFGREEEGGKGGGGGGGT